MDKTTEQSRVKDIVWRVAKLKWESFGHVARKQQNWSGTGIRWGEKKEEIEIDRESLNKIVLNNSNFSSNYICSLTKFALIYFNIGGFQIY